MKTDSHDLPSLRRLAAATAVALAAATGVLVVAVLPAEYGVDPLGTGRALGLMRVTTDETMPRSVGEGDPFVPMVRGPAAEYGVAHRTDTVEFELGPYEYLEYKYRMVQGATLVYSWQASATVLHDFHGAPEDGGPEVSVDRTSRERSSGSLTAPFEGMHGWYWENTGWAPVTIRLSSAGFYDGALESRSNRTRLEHAPAPALADAVPAER